MWIFTKYGFYSIAAKGKNAVMVRSRDKQHLANLKTRFPEIANLPIIEFKVADYQYRLIMPKQVWASLLYEMSMEQTWRNFKKEAEKFETANRMSMSYVDALHDIWFRMYNSVKRSRLIDTALDKLETLSKEIV